jgi:hypothetical protein
MSLNNTIWNKNFNHNNNNIKEGLKNERNPIDKDKDKEQHKVLDEIKRKLETMANKRKGFTKLPHLEGLNDNTNNNSDTKTEDKDTINKDKSDTKNDVSIKEGNTPEQNNSENIEGATSRGHQVNPTLPNSQQILEQSWQDFLEQTEQDFLEFWSKNSSAIGLGGSYLLFLYTYLQFYHLNFKNEIENIKSNSDETNEEIMKDILDSFAKTLGTQPWNKEINNNDFLNTLNTMAGFDSGVFLRYILIPAQVIVILLKNFIPNAKIFISNTSFTALFFILFGLIFTSITITKYTDINKERTFTDSENDFLRFLQYYYKMIPTSYFIVVGFIIISAFGLDTVRQMGTNSDFWNGGLFGVIGLLLFKIFALSLSVVLSGFSLIPIALYYLWWIIDPDPEFRNIFDKFPKALKHSYMNPEYDTCESNWFKKIGKLFLRKIWNNKILLLTIFVIDAILVMIHGREDMNDQSLYWIHGIIGLIILLQLPIQSGDYGILESLRKGFFAWWDTLVIYINYYTGKGDYDFNPPPNSLAI